MKRPLLFVLFLLSAVAVFSQGHKIVKDPLITVGDIPSVTVVNGKKKPTKTTAERIIANGKLVSNMPEYTIASYSVSIQTGADVWGPVRIHGSTFTSEIINQIKKTKGHGIKAFFDNIRVNTPDRIQRHYAPITLIYDN